MLGKDAADSRPKLPSKRKFGSRFQELYAKHWIASSSILKAELSKGNCWKSRTHLHQLPWETCPRGLFIVTKSNLVLQDDKISDEDAGTDEVWTDLWRSRQSRRIDSSPRKNRFEYLMSNHWLDSGSLVESAVLNQIPKNEETRTAITEDIELVSNHPTSVNRVVSNGARFDHLFKNHWNVYVAGSYGNDLEVKVSFSKDADSETCQLEPIQDKSSDERDSTSQERQTESGSSRWTFLRKCIKDKSHGARFQILLNQHYRTENSIELVSGLKPDKIWNEKFQSPFIFEEFLGTQSVAQEGEASTDLAETKDIRLRRFEMKVRSRESLASGFCTNPDSLLT